MLQVCLGDEKGALCRRCCVVPGLTHPEATAATGQKKTSQCLTRPVELVWQRHALYCVVDYCLGTAFATLQVCLGDEKGALCRRCCDEFGQDAACVTGQCSWNGTCPLRGPKYVISCPTSTVISGCVFNLGGHIPTNIPMIFS